MTTLAPPRADRPTRPPTTAPRRRRRRSVAPLLFLLPFALCFTAFFLVPIGVAVWQSLFQPRRSGLLGKTTEVFVGVTNYLDVFADPKFHEGLLRVVAYAVLTIPLIMVTATVVALLLDSALVRARKLFRLLVFLPYAVPAVIATLLWGFFYQPQFSPIVRTFDAFDWAGPDFLNGTAVLLSMTNIAAWEWIGYNMIIVLAALQAIPTSVHEAAKLDGCGELAIAVRVKLPMVLPAIGLSLLFSLIGAFQFFNEPAILKPLSATITSYYTPNVYAYQKAFAEGQSGYAGAIAVTLALVTFLFSLYFLRLGRRRGVI
ncbi:carbohydrate ABC transporter permease [Saccharothrix hoggarensis]|uniref:Carbohydrate ABC transporter permease n=1 Tax=Saccharothrix hoggarensis TaxID=913853 RepID=A0ABW3QPW8_9PSEU